MNLNEQIKEAKEKNYKITAEGKEIYPNYKMPFDVDAMTGLPAIGLYENPKYKLNVAGKSYEDARDELRLVWKKNNMLFSKQVFLNVLTVMHLRNMIAKTPVEYISMDIMSDTTYANITFGEYSKKEVTEIRKTTKPKDEQLSLF